jgi:glutamine synthetase
MGENISEKISGYKQLTANEVKKIITDNGIEMIRLEFSDLNGISRGKTFPSDMIDTVFENGIPFCSAIMAQCFDNEIATARGITEHNYDDMQVVPDPTTFVILPHIEKTALLLGNIFYHGKPMKQSPRGFLMRMIEEYRALGYNPIAAGELEFFLFKKSETGPYPLYTNKANNCYTNNMRSDPLGFLYKLTRTFKHMGFKILYMNHEYYPGQYEYNWKHGPALRNADETFLFKSISKDLAEQDDLYVTFMAKPKNNNGGSGCHIHISLNDLETGKDLFYDENDPDSISDMRARSPLCWPLR